MWIGDNMKKRTQYIIRESDKVKRREFYDYIMNKYNYKVIHHTKEEMINSIFPFVVYHKDKTFWVCESITCCAAAQQNGVIITIDEFKKISK